MKVINDNLLGAFCQEMVQCLVSYVLEKMPFALLQQNSCRGYGLIPVYPQVSMGTLCEVISDEHENTQYMKVML